MIDEQEPSDKLWEAATRDVKPLRGRKRASVKKDSKKDGINIRETRGSAKAPGAVKAAKGIDGRTNEKLRRGKFEIEARIDLHGFRQKEAQAELTKFLMRAHAAGKRCVLVITGKGKPKNNQKTDWWEGRPGVLRDMAPEWMQQNPLSQIVLQIHPAQPKDGGAGAFYVLLRRTRL